MAHSGVYYLNIKHYTNRIEMMSNQRSSQVTNPFTFSFAVAFEIQYLKTNTKTKTNRIETIVTFERGKEGINVIKNEIHR